MELIAVNGIDMNCAQVVAVAAGHPVRLTSDGRARARASMESAERAARTRPLYGRSTGVGANRTVTVTEDGPQHAIALLRSHATAAGPLRDRRRVRAMLAVRLNQLAAGGSGVNPVVLDGLVGMLSADALPPVRELGSVGTGDLSALATTALTLQGELAPARPLSGTTAFGAADGLAFISSNAAVLADAALGGVDLESSSRAALVVAALTFTAVDGNLEAFSPVVRLATPFPGAVRVCEVMTELTSAQVDRPARIQDPFGLRTLPQVHGPVLDAVQAALAVTERLINAPAENPLIVPAPGGDQIAHHGGFHLAYLQMALDGLNLAVAQSSQQVLNRLATLIEPALSGLPAFLTDGTPGASGVMVCEYVAASALGAIRAAATPAGLQSVTLSRGVEEDASFASQSAVQTLQVAERYRSLVACELVAAVRALRLRNSRLSGQLAAAMDLCRELPTGTRDRDLTPDLIQAEALVPRLADLVAW